MIQKIVYSSFSTALRKARTTNITLLSNIQKLQKTISKEHFFIRKNNRQIGQQIQTLIKTHNWQWLRRAMNVIDISELDSWLILRRIATALQKTLNNTEFKIEDFSQSQIEDMLTTINKLNFQPLENASSEYDSNQEFRQQFIKYIKEVQRFGIDSHYMNLVKSLVHTNPSFFSHNKEQIQSYILHNLIQHQQKGRKFIQLLSKGLISNFWSPSFKKKLQQKTTKQYLHPFYFGELEFPTIVEPNRNIMRVKTEQQIKNILEGYHYDVSASVNINDYEVDFMLSDFMIIEYNGHSHYAINSQKMMPTLKESWRKNILQKRGFVVSSISYEEWKFLKSFEEKRQYLVTKIQNDLLEFSEKGFSK